MEIEAKIRGILSSALLEIGKAFSYVDERVHWDNCKTSIFDLHRRCPTCSFELCLSCCQEIREGNLRGGCEDLVWHFPDRGRDYIHGGDPVQVNDLPINSSAYSNDCSCDRKANNDSSIPCAPSNRGGCGASILDLKCILPKNCVFNLENEAREIVNCFEMVSRGSDQCSCSSMESENLRRASFRKSSNDNHLFSSNYVDIQEDGLEHFQRHWMKGQPVIVRGVIQNASGLSWEPMVMWRALLRSMKDKAVNKEAMLKAIDCLAWCEVLTSMPTNFSKDIRRGACILTFGQSCSNSKIGLLLILLRICSPAMLMSSSVHCHFRNIRIPNQDPLMLQYRCQQKFSNQIWAQKNILLIGTLKSLAEEIL